MSSDNHGQNGTHPIFPSSKSIQREALRFIRQVVQDLHEQHPDLAFDGLVCEVESEGVGLYVHLHETAGGTHQNAEQHSQQDDPAWFSYLLELEDKRAIAAALIRVLEGISEGLTKFGASGVLRQYGLWTGQTCVPTRRTVQKIGTLRSSLTWSEGSTAARHQ